MLVKPERWHEGSACAALRLRNDLAFRLHMWYCSNLTPEDVFALRPWPFESLFQAIPAQQRIAVLQAISPSIYLSTAYWPPYRRVY